MAIPQFCPYCQGPLLDQGNSPNGGLLMVAEECGPYQILVGVNI